MNIPVQVSIIVPVYKAQATLPRCIDSILSQSFKDWELLLIDDGSTDDSGEICDEYARHDNRIQVFHKQNGGVSSARNYGLDRAKGEWVTFIDSDDWIELNYLSHDYSKLSKNETDLILMPFKKFTRDTDKESEKKIKNIALEIPKKNFTFKDYFEVCSVVCGKIFRRKAIGNLRFNQDFKLGEDTLFFLQFLKQSERIQYDGYASYVSYEFDNPDNFIKKYQLSVAQSAYCLTQILSLLKDLEITNKNFLQHLLNIYKGLCNEDMPKNCSIWYRKGIIKEYSLIYARQISFSYYLKTIFLFLPGIAPILYRLKSLI